MWGIILAAAGVALFHGWLYLWYFPKHCLSDRRVTWLERYGALLRALKQWWR